MKTTERARTRTTPFVPMRASANAPPSRLEGVTSPLHHWIVTIVCDDRPGIVHAATGAIVDALTENADKLLAQAPEILPADVLASKLP